MSLSHTLMLPCRKAAELVDKRSVMPLDLVERMKLWIHLKACAGCKAFERQGALIDQSIGSRTDRHLWGDQDLLRNRINSALDSSNAH